MRLQVHGQRRAQVVEAGVHLAGYGAAMGARCMRSAGSRSASGRISARYSAIASVSQTLTPSWRRHGTRNDGDSSKSSARVEGSSEDIDLLLELQAGHLAEQPAAQRPGRVVLAADRKYGCCHSARPSLIAAPRRHRRPAPFKKPLANHPQDALAFVRCTIGCRQVRGRCGGPRTETTCSTSPTKPIPT